MGAPLKDSGQGQIYIREAKLNVVASQEARQVAEKAATQERLAKEAIQKAQVERARAIIVLTGGNKESARLRHEAMRMLSGGNATQETIANMMRAETRIINNENIPTDQKQEKFQKAKSQYEKLLTFAQSRQEQTKKNIEKMKKSKDPIRQATGFDIEIALKKAEKNSFKLEIDRYNDLIKAGINDEGKQLKQSEYQEYQLTVSKLTEKQSEITKQLDGEEGKDGLITQRENIPGISSIPNIVEKIAVALTPEVGTEILKGEKIAGENAAAEIKFADEHPVEYLQNFLSEALTTPEGMKNLEERMVKANLLTEADKKSFEDFMNLGLDPKERAAMYAKNGGKGLLGLSGIMGLLAYLSWKKSQEGAGQQMG